MIARRNKEGLSKVAPTPFQAPLLELNQPESKSEFRTLDETEFSKVFRHHTAIVGGVRLHYVSGGTGDLVVLLHGWPTSWYEWRRVMPLLAPRYTVVAPDLRGLGDSDRPETG